VTELPDGWLDEVRGLADELIVGEAFEQPSRDRAGIDERTAEIAQNVSGRVWHGSKLRRGVMASTRIFARLALRAAEGGTP
jgi:hypothetical protein